MMHRLYHDFNNLLSSASEGIVTAPLVCSGTKRDLDELHLTLEEGMDVLLYQPDPDADGTPAFLEVEARVRYSVEGGSFVADFVWNELKHQADPTADEL